MRIVVISHGRTLTPGREAEGWHEAEVFSLGIPEVEEVARKVGYPPERYHITRPEVYRMRRKRVHRGMFPTMKLYVVKWYSKEGER